VSGKEKTMIDHRQRPARAAMLAATLAPALALAGAAAAATPLRPAVCFAPGTPPGVVERHRPPGLEPSTVPRAQGFEYQLANRWSSTASQGGGLGQGDPTVLTWSIVPDGTPVFGYDGEPSSPSNLRATLDGIYGSRAAWLALFQRVFDRWSDLTGVTYVFEPSDDGSPFAESGIAQGVVGVRGDVRIAGHRIDGTNGVLAYNFYPDLGDMVIDTADQNFASTASDSLLLRNVIAHEHGHGLGLDHVCPVDQTKLMEPFLSLAFDGPQHDDVLAANRGYGDRLEDDDGAGSASPLGSVGPGASVARASLSVDDPADADFLRLEVAAALDLVARASPVGRSYLSGAQNANGSCSSGSTFDSLRQLDLDLELRAGNGTSVLARAASAPAGASEEVRFPGLEPGTYYLRVGGAGGAAAQLYDLQVTAVGEAPAVVRGDHDGDGQADLTWHDRSSGSVGAWLMDRTAIVRWVPFGSERGTGWYVGGTGDWGGDGTTDLLWHHRTSGDLRVWHLGGLRLERSEVIARVGPPWLVAGTDDFDRDRRPDILWYQPVTGEVGVWLMQGVTRTGWASLGRVPLDWEPLGCGDLDGDGSSDVLWRNKRSGQTGAWRMDGTRYAGWLALPPVANRSWVVGGVGDFTGGASADIVWRHTGNGQDLVWELTAGVYAGWQPLPTVPVSWQMVGPR
jgi:hypothetical protein